MKTTMHVRITLAMAFAAAVLTQAVHAVSLTQTFTGTSPGDWATGANWSPNGRVPGSDGVDYDYAVVNGSTVTLASDMSANTRLDTIKVQGGGTLQLNSGAYLVTASGMAWDHAWTQVGINGSAGSLVVDAGPGPTAGLNTVELELGSGGNATFTLTSGTVTNRARAIFLGSGSGAIVNCYLNGGQLNSPTPYGMHLGDGSNSRVTVNQNGTLVTFIGAGPGVNTEVAFGRGAGSVAVWNLQSGTVGTGEVTLGGNVTGTGKIIQTGGTYYQCEALNVGGTGTGLYSISGGVFDTNQTYGAYHRGGWVTVGAGSGQGTFQVIGNGGTISVASYWGIDAAETIFTLGANGTLLYDINAPTVTPIQLINRSSNPNSVKQASLAGIIDLELNGYTPGYLATYDLLTARTILRNGVPLITTDVGFWLAPADVGVWRLEVLGTGGNGQTLRATFLPEPTSLALLALGSLALLKRQRKP